MGAGTEAVAGKSVEVQYVGVSWSTKKQFDASWDRGGAFSFQLGQGRVIKGWDQGVAGMKVGGVCELRIPPDLAYGPAGRQPSIPPNAKLLFTIEVMTLKPGK